MKSVLGPGLERQDVLAADKLDRPHDLRPPVQRDLFADAREPLERSAVLTVETRGLRPRRRGRQVTDGHHSKEPPSRNGGRCWPGIPGRH